MRGEACPMCESGRVDETPHGIRFLDGERSDAYLGREGPARGYAYVIWRGRHVAEPTELTAAEAMGYWQDVLHAARAIERHFEPCKMNYQLLGNGVPHLHTHLIPRYLDDVAPGGPLPRGAWKEGETDPIPEVQLREDVEALRLIERDFGA